LPYYLGGFLGPFGTMVVVSIYPELRDSFDASTAEVNWAFSGYLIPFAMLLLVSGTIGERLGRRRVTQWTFVSYSIASLVCVFAPTLGWFVAGRVLQGIGNAFITPLLLAGLTEVTAPERLGRAVGVYSSFQAAGGALAPFAAGLAATVDWRYVFVLVAVVAAFLATHPPPGEPRPSASAPPIKPLFTTKMQELWLAAFTSAAGPIGLAVLVGLYLRDVLDVGPGAAGVALLLGGLTAALLGPTWGRLLDRWGARRASAFSVGALCVVSAPMGLIENPIVLTIVWMIAGALVGFVVINIQHISATAVPDNRGGALSSVLSFRFVGHAVGPLVWVAVFDVSPAWAFAGAAGLGIITFFALTAAAGDA
jgi:MFS family permease